MSDQYQDISYLQSLYPDSTKRIMETVKATCDQYDYQGSCIYDEYPDRIWMKKIADSVYEQVEAGESMAAQDRREPGWDFRRDLIDVLLLNEIFCRRGWCDRGEKPGHRRGRHDFHGSHDPGRPGCRDCR